MTLPAQLPDRALDPSPRHDLPTDGMDSSLPFVIAPYTLLDNRTRGRLIPEAGAPAGRYLALEHEGETKLIALERPITHIGRGLVADVRLEDAQVSRRHAILAVRGDGARILDDRSYNGTFVNGRRITAQPLSDGDVVRFGRAVFRFTEIAPRRKPQPLRRGRAGLYDRRPRHPEPLGPAAA
ncbi:MAG: FHA domain-containing protein [Solirubrobacteraceae bacterium]